MCHSEKLIFLNIELTWTATQSELWPICTAMFTTSNKKCLSQSKISISTKLLFGLPFRCWRFTEVKSVLKQHVADIIVMVMFVVQEKKFLPKTIAFLTILFSLEIMFTTPNKNCLSQSKISISINDVKFVLKQHVAAIIGMFIMPKQSFCCKGQSNCSQNYSLQKFLKSQKSWLFFAFNIFHATLTYQMHSRARMPTDVHFVVKCGKEWDEQRRGMGILRTRVNKWERFFLPPLIFAKPTTFCISLHWCLQLTPFRIFNVF